jgi:choline dehydrogenase-like flavoprotein
MIHTYRTITESQSISAECCVIGTGAGGSAAAAMLAEQGREVVLLEAGEFLQPSDFSQREEEMLPRLFYDAGARTTADGAIRVLHGHGVGGSTLHNQNLCKILPREIAEEWNIQGFSYADFLPYLQRVETDLAVSDLTENDVNPNNRVVKRGIEALGYRGGLLRHNRVGCVRSGFCVLGCAYNAKMNAYRVYIPRAIEHGATVYANTRAVRLFWRNNRAEGIEAEVVHPQTREVLARLTIKTKAVVCSAGAIETPALLQSSGIPDPKQNIGKGLHLHPGAGVMGIFDETIMAWQGIPQSIECTEFLSFDPQENKRVWLVTASAHPVAAASFLPGFGKQHRELMQVYAQMASLSAMLHDVSEGTVRAKGNSQVEIEYHLKKDDRTQLALGLREAARILIAAGAKEVYIPMRLPLRAGSLKDVDALDIRIRDRQIAMASVHPMSSVRMGNDPDDSCCDGSGKLHRMANVFVADTSLFPTSIGIPPQVTTYAIGLWVGDHCNRILFS